VAALYQKSHPNVEIVPVAIPAGPNGGYLKINSALAAGGGPDLAQIEFQALPDFLLVNGVLDLSRYGAQAYRDKMTDAAWSGVSFGNRIWAAPQDTGPTGLFYRKDIFDSVGATAPPATRDEWWEVGLELKKRSIWMDTFPSSDSNVLIMNAIQAGARWFRPEEDGWVVSMTDDATLEVARFISRAQKEGIVATQFASFSPGWTAALAQGRVASIVSGSWADGLVNQAAQTSGKWRAALPPRWSQGFRSGVYGGSTTAVLANSHHPHEAAEFAFWMATDPEALDLLISGSGIGWSPAKEVIGTSRQTGDEFFGGQKYHKDVFVHADRDQNTQWTWWPVTMQSLGILADQFRKFGPDGKLVDAVAAAEQEIITVFQRKGLRIRQEKS
jgi:multiple sugar transport system substrate-binding protein